jgi:integrase
MSSHEFRHLAASRWLHEGVLSPAEIAARLGHTTPAVLMMTYAHVLPPSD